MAAAGASQPSALELERQQRILRNTQRLAELGLLQNPLSGAAEAAARAGKKRRERPPAGSGDGCSSGTEHLVPQRQSRRQRGEAPENGGHGYGASLRQQRERPAAPTIARQWRLDLATLDCSGAADPAVDAHNLMRVKSMSARALQTRIWKIRRVDKLHSFVKVLEACGMEELAAEAREALAQMTGGAPVPVL